MSGSKGDARCVHQAVILRRGSSSVIGRLDYLDITGIADQFDCAAGHLDQSAVITDHGRAIELTHHQIIFRLQRNRCAGSCRSNIVDNQPF